MSNLQEIARLEGVLKLDRILVRTEANATGAVYWVRLGRQHRANGLLSSNQPKRIKVIAQEVKPQSVG